MAICGPALAGGPLDPQAAIADFRLPPGYRIELVASEPQVVDPVAIAFDEDARLWVVEMRDYPSLGNGESPSSRIRILEDHDGDGHFESATTYAEGLLFPTGIQPWRGGVIVTLAGEVAYFPDEDGDNRADPKVTWYRGFATDNEQLRANHPTLAADGWVYVASGLRGGTIENLRDSHEAPRSISGRDFAFDPVKGKGLGVTGNGQFGLAFDDFGRRFTCSNRNPLIHVVLEQRYLEQNPNLILPAVVHDVAASGADSRLFPRTRALTTSALHTGQFTAACGLEIHRDPSLAADSLGDAFICEPTANLIHRETLRPDGATFCSAPVEKQDEFLTSSDEWFRPVNLHSGPDGALFVVDMYRAVIEHPQWVPEDVRHQFETRLGSDRGRIYRIVHQSAARPPSPLAADDPKALVGALEDPISWRRNTAARLLLAAGDSAPVADLRKLAATSASAPARFHAICLLASLGSLDAEILRTALADPASGVRERAIVLAEAYLRSDRGLADRVMALGHDSDPRVRFQATLSMSLLPAREITAPLLGVARRDAADPWTRRAIILAARGEAARLLGELLLVLREQDAKSAEREGIRQLSAELASAVVATDTPEAVAGILVRIGEVDDNTARKLLYSIAEALERRGTGIDRLLTDRRDAAAAVDALFDAALVELRTTSARDDARSQSARLLRYDLRPITTGALLDAYASAQSPDLQIAIIEALHPRAEQTIALTLIDDFPHQVPSVRRASLAYLTIRAASAASLLQAIASGEVAATEIDALSAQRLRQHEDPTVRELAEEMLSAGSKDRESVVERYQSALSLTGDLHRGAQVFASNCANCHRLGRNGAAIGPDIGDSVMKTSSQLLVDILNPNQAIDANYVSFTALTQSGQVYQGMVRSETDSAIVLLSADGTSHEILRGEIESLGGNLSLMPEGLEQQIGIEQMADLLAYLKSWRQLERAPVTIEGGER